MGNSRFIDDIHSAQYQYILSMIERIHDIHMRINCIDTVFDEETYVKKIGQDKQVTQNIQY